MNLDEFAKKLSKQTVINKIETDIANTKKNTALFLLKQLVDTTPVDTGKAISNWVVDINIAPIGEIEAHHPGKKKNTHSENKEETMFVAIQQLENIKSDDIIHVTNNCQYISNLNAGTSKQAAPNFVESCIEITKKNFKSISNIKESHG